MSGVSKRMNSIKLYVMVGIGGSIGAILRYGMSSIHDLFTKTNTFPLATLVTNLIGCFLLSFILNHRHMKAKIRSDYLVALTAGVLGAFTTFSTVMVETFDLWLHHLSLAIIYVGLSVIGGLTFCYSGYKLATREVQSYK